MSQSLLGHCSLHFHKLDRSCIWLEKGTVVIREKAQAGAGAITFTVPSDCLVLRAIDDKPPMKWLKEKKCADGAFIHFRDGSAELHIIELKSGLRLKDWQHVRVQFQGMFLNAVAISGFIDLRAFDKIVCYVAYSRDLLQPANPSALVLRKFQLGTGKALADIGDWLAGTVEVAPNLPVKLVKIQRDAEGNGSHQVV